MTFAMATLSLPQILTHSVVPSLVEHLDASDVLECYSLTRNARLSGPFQNATIQKMALGLRYDPPANSHKQPLELTLEYGPQRIGADLEGESMPLVMSENRLSWENEGKVYYTTASIQEYRWKSAYYMASISGAVLEKILERAVTYSTKKPRYQPFAVVTAHSSDASDLKQVLKSSSSVDFVYEMWTDMADLGVDLRPILTPPSYIPRLHIAGKVEKVSGYDDDGRYIPQEAASFYKALADCFSAIATGDYSEYATDMPTTIPSIAPSSSPSNLVPSQAPSVTVTEALTSEATTITPTVVPTSSPTSEDKDAADDEKDAADDRDSNETNSDNKSKKVDPIDSKSDDESGGNEKAEQSEDKGKSENDEVNDSGKDDDEAPSQDNDDGKGGAKDKADEKADDTSAQDNDDDDDNDSAKDETDDTGDDDDQKSADEGEERSLTQRVYEIAESLLPRSREEQETSENDDVFITELAHHNLTSNHSSSSVPSASRTATPSMAPTEDNTKSASQKAANEASEAVVAAKNASSHGATEKAVEEVEHAADAAQKAASAAKWEKDMEDILSGDGMLVTQAFSQCWTDPTYRIASENTSNIMGYMYFDGNFFYRLNLTVPYLDVVELQRPIPQLPAQSNATVDDFVDWTLAFCIMGLCILGLCLFAQQIGLPLAFHKHQKFFFNPTKHGVGKEDELDDTDDDESESQHRGRGQEHGFPADVIPLSMGGSRLTFRNSQLLVTNSPTAPRSGRDIIEAGGGGSGEIELTELPGLDGDDAAPTTQLPPRRFTRHPDWVDLPHLKSRTRTARPVTLNSLSDHDDSAMDRMHSL